jgi:hypothetical protein
LEFELGGIGGFGFPPLEFGRSADGFHGLDVERRVGRRRDGEETFPEIMEFEEEFDFFWAQDFVHDLHGGLALGTEQRIFAPDAHDEVAPERTEFAIGLLWVGDGGGRGWWVWRGALGMGALAGG